MNRNQIYATFEKLGFDVFGTNAVRKKDNFAFNDDLKEKIEEIYAIASIDVKFNIFLIETNWYHHTTIKKFVKALAKEYRKFILITIFPSNDEIMSLAFPYLQPSLEVLPIIVPFNKNFYPMLRILDGETINSYWRRLRKFFRDYQYKIEIYPYGHMNPFTLHKDDKFYIKNNRLELRTYSIPLLEKGIFLVIINDKIVWSDQKGTKEYKANFNPRNKFNQPIKIGEENGKKAIKKHINKRCLIIKGV